MVAMEPEPVMEMQAALLKSIYVPCKVISMTGAVASLLQMILAMLAEKSSIAPPTLTPNACSPKCPKC